jgi:hypothetical protein
MLNVRSSWAVLRYGARLCPLGNAELVLSLFRHARETTRGGTLHAGPAREAATLHACAGGGDAACMRGRQ